MRNRQPYTALRIFLKSLLLCASVTVCGSTNPRLPTLHSIRMVTISSSDVTASARRYVHYLGYDLVEDGTLTTHVANAWRAPAMAGRSYLVLRSPDPVPVFVRFVETAAPKEPYAPVSSAGWNALELLVRDPYAIHSSLVDSPFKHLDGPAPLMGGSSVHAAQYLGPDGEVLYLTADLKHNQDSTLARTQHRVGRPFIVVIAGADIDVISQFYAQNFKLTEAFRVKLPIPFMAAAQQRELTHTYPLALLRLQQFSHSIEIDEYPEAPARARRAGELPPGISVVTFCGAVSNAQASIGSRNTDDSSGMIPGLRKVSKVRGIAYAGQTVSFLNGAGGELIEVLRCESLSEPVRESALH